MKVICKGHKTCEYGFKNINDHYCNHSIPHECNDEKLGNKYVDPGCYCSGIFLRKDKLKKINESR